MARLKLALLVTAFVALTALGVWYAAPPGDVLARFGRELAALPIGALGLLAVLSIACLLTEMLRLVIFGRVLGMRITARAAFDASLANDLFTWISPWGILGEPAAIWFMTKRGIPAETALAISFGKFATSFALFMGLAAVLFVIGFGPAVPQWAMFSIAFTIGFGAVLVGGFVIGTMWPAPARKLIAWLGGAAEPSTVRARLAGLLQRSLERLAMFRDASLGDWLAITASHVLYYASYIGLFLALGWMFDVRSLCELVPVSVVYQAFAYIVPSPGIPEAGANAFFGDLFAGGGALVVVILFRGLTAYVQVLLGLIYLPVRGVADALLSRRARR